MLRDGLKLDQVHAFTGLYFYQIQEKLTWVNERIAARQLSYAKPQEESLVFIVCLSGSMLTIGSEKQIRDEFDSLCKQFGVKPLNYEKSIDFTEQYKDIKWDQRRYDRQSISEIDIFSMVDFSNPITNNSNSNVILIEP